MKKTLGLALGAGGQVAAKYTYVLCGGREALPFATKRKCVKFFGSSAILSDRKTSPFSRTCAPTIPASSALRIHETLCIVESV